MLSFTLVYGLIALLFLVVVAASAYYLGGWKAAIFAATIALLVLAAGLVGLVALITRSM